jgi:hypothetical protein
VKDLPDALRGLDRRLQDLRFEPRASLGPEILGRWRRGEWPGPSPADRRTPFVALAGLGALVCLSAVLWLLVLEPGRLVTVDRCCQDLDGGGDADDGIVVTSHKGVTVRYLKIYEDLDRSGGYTPGDAVRFLREGVPVLAGPFEGTRTAEFCCMDYDGGGASDDALVVMGRPPDRISMAAIYEHRGTDQPAALR